MRPDHHLAWLSLHPHRSDEWFAAKLQDGFDIHHLDGDRANNDPRNLVMIEHTDHFALHNGGFYTLGRLSGKRGLRRKRRRSMSKREETKIQGTIRIYEESQKRLIDYAQSFVGLKRG